MRTRSSMLALIVAVAAGAVAWSAWNGAGRAAMPMASGMLLADQRPGAVPVDVELVLAVDVSYSMDPDEQALQREGYITGITSPEFLQALRQGINGKVAITYFEWAGPGDQKIVLPWRLIDGPRRRPRLPTRSRTRPIAAPRAPRSRAP